ncbi:hypothetical protein IGI04_042328 [Brassica rapa subsp. trilocularis]|uniref:Uncharacterized protein n=1 Tax=Brassica rapa subsp. trilocularis TaxID=1813537 RepID=A0ABQ7KIK0_BRACM|nr:hypothetical protein IGI04_042328 [Brassica rapa subsp. trilocularis]
METRVKERGAGRLAHSAGNSWRSAQSGERCVLVRISVGESGTVTGRADGPGAGRFDQMGLRLGTGSGQAPRVMDLRQKYKEKAKEKEKEVAPGDRSPKDQKWTVVREKHHEDRGHGKMCGDWVDSENCVIIVACNLFIRMMNDMELVAMFGKPRSGWIEESRIGFYSGCPPAHTGHPWLTHISTLVLGLSTLALPVDCSGDFGLCGLSVQYIQDIRGCPPPHTGRPWLFVAVHGCLSAHTGRPWLSVCPCVSVSTHMTSVAIHQNTYQHAGPWTHHAGPSRGLFRTSVCVRQHTQDVRGFPSVHISARWSLDSSHWPFPWTVRVILAHVGCLFSTHRTSVGVRQHTQDVRGCPSAHTGRPWLSVCVRVCPSAHTGRSWLSISTYISTLVLGLSTLTLPVDCSGDFGPRGLSVQYTKDFCGCPPAPTGRSWLSVCVRVCPSAHTGRLWLSISTHISTLVLGLSTLALPVGRLGDFGPCGLSVPVHTGHPWHTHDVRGYPSNTSQHAGPLDSPRWPFLCWDCSGDLPMWAVCFSTHRTSVGIRPAHTGSPCVSVSPPQDVVFSIIHISARWSLINSHWPFPWDLFGVILAHVGCLFSTHRTSVGVRQHTQDVRGCPSAHTGRPWLSVCVRVCPSAHTGRSWLSISTYISTLVLGLSTLTLPVDCSGDFGPRGLSVQYTKDFCGCPPAPTGRSWLSVCVRVCPSAHTGRLWLSISTHISTLVLGLSTLALPVDCLGDFGPCGLSVQYTQDVHGCPSEHIGRLWLSVSTHRTSVAVRVCLCLSVCVRQHTQNVHGCTSAHTGRPCVSVSTHTQDVCVCPCVRLCPCVSVSRHMTSVAIHQYTYQHEHTGLSVGVRQHTQDVRGCPSAHTRCPWLSISTHRLSVAVRVCPCVSVCVRQHTQDVCDCPSVHISARWSLASSHWPFPWTVRDVCGCPSAHTGRPWLFVCVCVCPSAHTGRPWLSISTHISTLVLELSTLTLPVDCSGDFGPRGLSVQYTKDFRGCPPAHTGRSRVSVCVRQHTQDVCGCPSIHISARRMRVSASTHRTSVAVGQHTQDVCGCPSTHTGCQWLSMCVRVCPSAHTGRLWPSISTLALPVDCSGDFGSRGLSVQYTQDVRGCSSAHTRRPCVSVSIHRTSVAVYQDTHISTLVLGLSTLTLLVDCSGDFGPRGMSVQYTQDHTQDVCGCPSAHTGRLCVSANTHMTSVAVAHTGPHTGLPWLSISTHISTLVLGLITLALPVEYSAHTGHPWLSISTHISTLVLGLNTLTLPVDCSGDFGPRGLSVLYTKDFCRCPPAHTERSWLSVCVRVCPSAHTGRLWLSISTHISTFVLGLSTLALPVDCLGDIGPRGLSLQYTQDIRGCPPAHTGRSWLSVSTHRTSVAVRVCPCVSVSTHRMSVCVRQHTQDVRVFPSAHTGHPWLTLALPVDCLGDFGPRGLSVQYTQDVRGCPPPHTGHPWLSISTHRTSVAVRVCPCVSVSTHMTSVGVRQHTQDVRGYPCVSVSTHRTSVAFHQYTYQHVGRWTQHADPSRGLFGTSVVVRQHTQDVRGCPSAHTGRPWLSLCVCVCPCVFFSTHRTSMGVRQHTQDVRCVRQHTQDVCGCPCVSVCVHQHTQDIRVCPSAHTGRPWLSVWVCVCPSAHTGRLWLSISTHISTLVLGLSTLALPADCLGDFGPRGLSVQYTQDFCACPPAHTGRPWLSVITHKTSVAVRVCLCVYVCVRQHTQDVHGCTSAHTGRPCVSVSTHRTSVAVRVSVITHMMSVAIHQYTYQHVGQHTQVVCGCPSAHTGRSWLSVCPCVSVSTHRTSVAVHQYTYQHAGPWTHHAGPSRGLFSTHKTPVAVHQYTYQHAGPWTHHAGPSRGLFGTHMTSVAVCVCSCLSVAIHQYTYQHDVRGCPPAHTGRPWLSVAVRQHTQDVCGCPCVRVCPSAHTGRPWLSISTHISTLVLGLTTLALPVDCSGDFGPCGLSVQYTQDVRVCPSAHTGRQWLSIRTHISTLVLGHITLALPVDCSGNFGPRGLSVQYTQDVFGCPSAHTRRPWVSISTHRTSVAIRVCPCVSVSTHWTSVAVHQYTYQHVGPWTQHADPSRGLTFVAVRVCPSAHTGHLLLSISTHISTLVLGLSTLAVPVDCLGDFGPRGLSVQYTQDIRGCPPAHTGRLWLSVITHNTSVAVRVCPCLYVCVRQHTYDVHGCTSAHIGRPCVSGSTHRTSVAVRVSPCVSVCVHQHTHDGCGYPSVHISARWSLDSALWPFLWTVWVILAHVGCLFSTHRTSVGVRQHTQDVRGCPSAHTGRPWLSVSTHRRLWLSVSTQRTFVAVRVSVCVRQHTQDICGCPSVHISARWSLDSPRWPFLWTVQVILAHVGCLFSTHRTSVGVCQHTQDVRGCPAAHAGRLWLSVSTHRMSVAVRVCLCVSVSIHRTSVAVHQHAGPSHGMFSTHRTSVGVRQHTQDVSVCLSAHTGRLWLFVCVCVCPSAHTGLLWLSISTHISTLVVGLSTLALPVDGHLWLSVSTHRTSVCVCGSPSTHTGRLWLSISTHISTLVVGLSTLALPMDCSGDFGPRGLSAQYTQDVRGCPSAHTGLLCVSVSTHRTSVAVQVFPCLSVCVCQHTQDVRGCPSVHISARWFLDSSRWPFPWTVRVILAHVGCLFSTHRTSVGVRQHPQDVRVCPSAHTGRLWLSISTHISTLVLGLTTLAFPVDCSGDFGPCGLSVQYTQDVRGCPSAHTGRPCVSVSTHRTSVAVHVCPGVSVCVCQHTQDVRGCPSVHISARWSLSSSRWPFPWTLWVILAHVGCLFNTHRTSVGVRQHTQDIRGCPSPHTGRPWLSVCVCVCPSAHTGRPWLFICTHISTLVLGLSTLTLPVDCSGDFGPRGLSVQYTKDFRGCLPAHTGRSTLALPVDCLGDFGPRGLSVQYTQVVRGCPPALKGRPWLYVSTHRMSVAVRVCPSAHTGRPWVSVSTHRTTNMMSGAIDQYTYQHVGLWTQHAGPSRGLFRTCVAVHQDTHISTLVLGLSTLTLPVDCSGDFSPRGLSVQYTQDVCVCPSVAVYVCPCVSVCVRQHTQDICGCPPAHIGRLCVSVSTHRTSVAVRVLRWPFPWTVWVILAHVGSLFSTHRTTVGVSQHTQDVCGCPSAHTGRPWLSVSTHRSFVAVRQHTQDVRGCPCVRVCPSAHTGRPWLSISTHISTLVLGLTTLALPVDCSGDFGPCGLSVQYTQDVRGCLSAHTGCPCVSVSTHKTPVAVHQYTYQHAGPWTHHAGPSRGLFGTSVAVRQHTQDACGCPSAHTGRQWLSVCVRVCPSAHIGRPWPSISTLALPMDCSRDFGPCGLSVQYTQDIRGCSSAHTRRPCVSVSTHRTSVAVHQDSALRTGRAVCVSQHTQEARGCRCVSRVWSVCIRQHPRTSVGVPFKHTRGRRYGVRQHTGRPVAGRVCLCVSVRHTRTFPSGCPLVQHIALWSLDSVRWPFPWTVWVILAHVGSLFSTHRTTVGVRQHTQDICGCPSAQTGRPSVSVALRQHTQNVCGCPSVHISAHWSMDSARWPFPWTVRVILAHVGCLLSTHRTSVGVRQHTQDDVRGCPSVHISARWFLDSSRWPFPWTVRVILAHVGCLFSTHRTSVGVRQHPQDVRVCPSAHTGRPWLSISTHISTLVLGLTTLAFPVDCSGDFGPCGLSVQYTQDVCGCPSAHTGRSCVSVSTHRTSVAVHVCPGVSVCVCQHTQDVRGCPSVHISARWSLGSSRWPFPWTVRVILAHVGCLVNTHRTSVGVRQHTQDICGCPSPHTGRPWLSVCVCVCPSAHTGCPWLFICTHISTLVLGLSTLTLPVDCSGDFSPRGLSVQYTQDVCVCPSVAVYVCPCVSVCVRQHTQDICGCPPAHIGRLCVSVSTHRTSVAVRVLRWPFPWTVWVILAHVGSLFSTHRTTVGVSQHTQDVCGCPSAHTGRPWLSVSTHRSFVAVRQHTQDVRGCPCVRVCPSAHTGRPWLSISTHISTLVLGLTTLALPVDCSGDFGPCGLSVQYTQDVRGCLSAHTGCPCVSVSTHKTPVAVHQYTYQHAGPWTHHAGPSRGLFGTSVAVRQHTQDACGCPSAHTGRQWLSVCVRVCPSAHIGLHTGHPWVFVSTHTTSVCVRQHTQDVCGCPSGLSTLVLGLSTLTLPVDCSGDFGPRGLSVQYAQDVRVCPSAHTGRPWLSVCVRVCLCVSVSTHRTSVGVRQHTQDVSMCLSAHTGRLWLFVCVCVCPSAHTGLPWLSISTHISTLVVGLSTLALPVDGHLWLSVSTDRTSECVCGSPSTHTERLWLSISTHISTLVDGLSTLALPMDCSGDFGPRGLSAQYTQDVRGCPSAHTGRPCVSVSTHMTSVAVQVFPCLSVCVCQHTQDVRGCPSVHISARWFLDSSRWPFPWTVRVILAHVGCLFSTHRTSVGVRQHPQDVRVCPSAHTGRPWLSISTHISTLVLGLTTLAFPVDCSGDFGPCGLSVQYTQDVCGCPSAHTGRSCVSVSTHRTSVAVHVCPGVSVCVCQHTQDVRGCPSVHISARWSLGSSRWPFPWTVRVILAHVGCLVNTHRTSVGVRQHTQDIRGCPSPHTGRPWLSVCVCVCPSAHTGCPWLFICTHISTLVLGLSTLTLPVDCSGDFGPRGLSVPYTKGLPWVSASTHRTFVLSCVSVSTHRTSLAVRVCRVCVRQHT